VPKPEISIQVFGFFYKGAWIWLSMPFSSVGRFSLLEPEKGGSVSHWVLGYSGLMVLKIKEPVLILDWRFYKISEGQF